jgi:hypothetical protein
MRFAGFVICHLSAIGYRLSDICYWLCVSPAMRFADCTGVLVRTGKFQLAQIEKSEISPDAILDSLAGLPGLLGPKFPAR